MIIEEKHALALRHSDNNKAWEIQPSEPQWPSLNHKLIKDEVTKWLRQQSAKQCTHGDTDLNRWSENDSFRRHYMWQKLCYFHTVKVFHF